EQAVFDQDLSQGPLEHAAMPSIETYADRFTRLDHAIRNAPPEMPDEDFDQLVRDWGHAAEVIASATADVTHDVVLTLYTLARLIGVGGIGTRELKIIEVIRWDMRRLAAH